MKKILIILCISILISACTSQNNPQQAEPTNQGTPAPASETAMITNQPLTPTQTQTAPPTSTPVPTETASPMPSPTPVNYSPGKFPDGVNPLTGLMVNDPTVLDRLPVAVKINNYPRSDRPQWGLSQADIVFEYYHNNWLPRFHAIFYSQDAAEAGPVRSGRLLDAILVQTYQSILAFASADFRILNNFWFNIPQNLVFNIERECPPQPYCRYEPGGANHLIGNTAEIRGYAEENGLISGIPDFPGMAFSSGIPAGGLEGSSLVVRYSLSAYTKWVFDPQTGAYTRWQDTMEAYQVEDEVYEVLTDRATGEEIQAQNVIILFAPHSRPYYHQGTETDPIGEIVEIDLTGSGQAVLFRDGLAYKLQWMRTDEEPFLQIVDDLGNPFPLKPGQTWFEVINDVSTESYDGTDWRFTFQFPLGD